MSGGATVSHEQLRHYTWNEQNQLRAPFDQGTNDPVRFLYDSAAVQHAAHRRPARTALRGRDLPIPPGPPGLDQLDDKDHASLIHEHLEFYPFGEVWREANIDFDPGPQPNVPPFLFTGKEFDPETGLTYFGARYYDSKLARWISNDPALLRAESHQPLQLAGYGNELHREKARPKRRA